MSARRSQAPRTRRGVRGATLALLGGAALLLAGCSSTEAADDYDGEDIEVHVPTQLEAEASAAAHINAGNADAEYQKLLDEIAEEE